MRGFGGVVYWDRRPLEPGMHLHIANRLRHRGPDGMGTLEIEGGGIVQAVLDLRGNWMGGDLPQRTPDGNFVMAADVVLYNRAELLGLLGENYALDGAVSDAAILLAAYRQWGARMLEKLDGEYAFAVWDAGQRRFFAARDAFGARPFYYRAESARFLFASEVKALLGLPGVPVAPDDRMVGEFLTGNYRSRDRSFFEGTAVLPPGHFLQVDENNIRIERWWRPDPGRELTFKRPDDLYDQFRHMLREAVKKRLDLGVPTALMLSGGVDSASIAVLAGDIYRSNQQVVPKLETISAVFPGLVCDETPSIRAVLERVPFHGHLFQPAVWSFQEATLSELLWYSDSPIANSQIGFYEGVLAWVGETGTVLLLDGFGGDELLDEEKRLLDLAARGSWAQLLVDAWRLSRASWASIYRILYPCVSSVVPQPVKKIYRSLRTPAQQSFPPWMQPSLAAIVQNGPAEMDLDEGGFSTHLQNQVYKNYQYPGLFWDLTLQDAMGAHHGYLSSSPFCDRDLVEFVLAVNFHNRSSDGHWKFLARRALRDDLPALIRHPRRSPWYNAYASRAMGNMVPVLSQVLFAGEVFLSSRYIDKAEAKNFFQDYHQGRAESSFWQHVHPLWVIACLEFWLRELSRYNISIDD